VSRPAGRIPGRVLVPQRIKSLFRNLAIYGLGDVATSLISLLLLPVYTQYFAPADYGVIAMLLTVEAFAKILFRWGVDTAFMRLYFDCPDHPSRQRLASTLFFFLLAINGSLLLIGLVSAGRLSELLFDTREHALLVRLMITNTFVVGFYFIPFQVLRINEQSQQFIALVFGRSAGTLILRLALVVGLGMGVLGVVVADIAVTGVFTIVLSRWFAPLIRPVFSRTVIREALGFGLPRIPHSLANQAIALADRYFLKAYRTLEEVGLYSIGATFGLALKLFLSAFEFAWTPFFLGAMHEPDAKQIYSRVSTYAIAVLVLLVAGLCAVSPDLVRLFTDEAFHTAAIVTPWIALGVMFQGTYIVGSIGLVITKRTTLYPLATGLAAGTSLMANAMLIPRYGALGAAWANAIAYGTLAAVTIAFSWRLYPIPYEWARLLRVAIAGGAAFAASEAVVPDAAPPLVGFFLRGGIAGAVYLAVLALTGFFHPGELRVLEDIRRRVVTRGAPVIPEPEPGQVEMAGEIVDTGPEPSAPVETEPASPARRGPH